jgi:ABC-type transport system involved in multi-copper enzyme maturation permease subunit
MLPLLRSEAFRLSRRGMPRILLIILALLVFAIYLLLWSVIRTQPEGMNPADLEQFRDALSPAAVRETGMSMVQSVGSVMAVILGASIISSEFGWGTIRTILPRAGGRGPFITAKLIALAAFVLVLAVTGYVVAVAGSTTVTLLESLGGSPGDALDGGSLAAIGRTAYVMLPYTALGFAVAVWTRSTAAGIGVGLAVLFLEGLVVNLAGTIAGPLGHVGDVLLSRNVAAIIQANSRGTGAGLSAPVEGLPDVWRAAGVLAVYTAVFVALSYWSFHRRDITAT